MFSQNPKEGSPQGSGSNSVNTGMKESEEVTKGKIVLSPGNRYRSQRSPAVQSFSMATINNQFQNLAQKDGIYTARGVNPNTNFMVYAAQLKAEATAIGGVGHHNLKKSQDSALITPSEMMKNSEFMNNESKITNDLNVPMDIELDIEMHDTQILDYFRP